MDCTEIRPLISYYYDGEVTPEEQTRVERHLAECEDCRRVLAEYRAIGGGVREMAIPAPPAGLRRDVWRAIEAQGAGGRAVSASPTHTSKRNQGKVVQFPQNRNKPALAGVFTNFESGWSRALTAALVVGALFIALGVLIVLQRSNNVGATSLMDNPPYSDYAQVVHVQFNRTVLSAENVTDNVQVYRLEGSNQITVNPSINFSMTNTGGVLIIAPQPTWDAGAKYEIYIDGPHISRGGVTTPFDSQPDIINFSTVAYTPTPTETPTNTPVPTDTPIPPTQQPTTVAENTAVPTVVVPGAVPSDTPAPPASSTPEPPKPTNTSTPRPIPTATSVPPTATPIPPTDTPVPPSATPTLEPSSTPTESTTPHSGTPTPRTTATPRGTTTPRPSSGTPTPSGPCDIMPVNGFGKIWSEHSDISNRIGCPIEHETSIQVAAAEHFQGGYMFWRGDTKTIYVFFAGSPNDTVGTWEQFPDTWQDGDPEPTPDAIAPTGLYIPVRGFGKIWRDNSNIRQALGYAIEPELGITAAWQAYQHGFALWTDDKVIRFMFNDSTQGDNIWERFADTFILPTDTPTP